MKRYLLMTKAELAAQLAAVEAGISVKRSKQRAKLAFALAAANQALRREIAEHRRVKEELRRLAAIVESSDDAIISRTLEDIVISWNKGAERIYGYRAKEIIGKSFAMLMPPDRPKELRQIRAKIRRGERIEHFETVRLARDGRRIFVSQSNSPIKSPNGKIIGISTIARDVSRQRQLEKELLEIGEQERRRIGQDLHDELCQQLTTIEFLSQALEQQLPPENEAAAARIEEIATIARQAMAHTRELARGLCPVELEAEGLMSALKQLASRTERIFKIKCRFDCKRPVLIQDVLALHLYRIAQEAVTNAVKHSRCSEMRIVLKKTGPATRLVVFDNGIGLAPHRQPPKGMGLRIMQYRASMANGMLAIQNRPKGGTMVTFCLNGESRQLGERP